MIINVKESWLHMYLAAIGSGLYWIKIQLTLVENLLPPWQNGDYVFGSVGLSVCQFFSEPQDL